MENLQVKEVSFNGADLLAAQNKDDGKIYVGVSWVCSGIGFSKNQKDRQVKNVQSDVVHNNGCVKFDAGVIDPNNETLALDINFLPLWLAKISITPTMKKENPEMVDKLIEYQLQAKDVLAKAFLDNQLPAMISDYINMSDEDKAIEYFTKLKENKVLGETIKLQAPKVEKYDKFIETDGLFSMEIAAKLIEERLNSTKEIGRNTLYKILRLNKVLQTEKYKGDQSHNVPYQSYIDRGYFTVKVSPYSVVKKNGDVKTGNHYVTHVTTKGLEFIYKLLKDKNNKN